jgi:hypothetical protein
MDNYLIATYIKDEYNEEHAKASKIEIINEIDK